MGDMVREGICQEMGDMVRGQTTGMKGGMTKIDVESGTMIGKEPGVQIGEKTMVGGIGIGREGRGREMIGVEGMRGHETEIGRGIGIGTEIEIGEEIEIEGDQHSILCIHPLPFPTRNIYSAQSV
jgi:hypothetical protein